MPSPYNFTLLAEHPPVGRLDPASARAEPDPVLRQPATAWPQVDSLTATLESMSVLCPEPATLFQPLGDSQPVGPLEITCTPDSWAFIAEIRVDKPADLEAPRFLLFDVEVLSGEPDVAVLAMGSGSFIGNRHRITGRKIVQLPIHDPRTRGIVFCNGGISGIPTHFRVHSISSARLNRTGEAAGLLRTMLEAEAAGIPPEVGEPSAVPPTIPLVFHRLLAQGKIPVAARLLDAIQEIAGACPAWVDRRLAELLYTCPAIPAGEPPVAAPPPASAEIPASGETRFPPHVLEELSSLRAVTERAKVVPLQLELLELMLMLDLVAVSHHCHIRFEWDRQAYASTPLARGTLCSLLALLIKRLQLEQPVITLSVTSDIAGTTIFLRSPLAAGALQYQTHSALSADLIARLHHPGCPLPDIGHEIGAETELRLTWRDSLPAVSPARILVEHRVSVGEILYQRPDGHTIVLDRGICYKTAPVATAKPNNLIQEAAVLRSAGARTFIPLPLAALETPAGTAMSYCYVPGQTLFEWATTPMEESAIIRVLFKLSALVAELNRCGIQHRDLRAENVLVTKSGEVRLLDFDQARLSDDADDFGNEWALGSVCAGFGGLLGQLDWRPQYLRIAGSLGFAWILGRFSSANSPGRHSCYYDWHWGGYKLIGERPWHLRWDLLRTVFTQRLAPGRFLELGSNLGLLSIHASLNGWRSLGLEHNALAVAAADHIAAALGVSAEFQRADLADPAAFSNPEGAYDLVAALSVLHWIPDRTAVEAFLRKQPRLLYEGHRSMIAEDGYLRGLGFSSVELLGYSERLRPILFATRT